MQEDSGEYRNRFDDPANKDEVQRLGDHLQRQLDGGSGVESQQVEMDDSMRRQLESLGYIN